VIVYVIHGTILTSTFYRTRPEVMSSLVLEDSTIYTQWTLKVYSRQLWKSMKTLRIVVQLSKV
jgi:hypothetical protein